MQDDHVNAAGKNTTPTPLSEPTASSFNGWFPVYLDLEHYRNMPFAFFRGNYEAFNGTGWFQERKGEIEASFRRYATLQEEKDIRIRFVLLPPTLQLAEPHIKNTSEQNEFTSGHAAIVKNIDTVRGEVLQLAANQGFDVLDMTVPLSKALLSEKVIWPGDIHYSRRGYEVVAQSIFEKWR